MASLLRSPSVSFTFAMLFWLALADASPAFSAARAEDAGKPGETLVRVNIISELQGIEGGIEINGKLVEGYSPVIIRDFSSTGIVIEGGENVLTFLGYHWVDIQSDDPRIEITTGSGGKLKGSLVGIDQSNGAAVIRLIGGTLRRTPACRDCELTDGAVVMAPVVRETGIFQFRKAEVVSGGTGSLQTAATGSGPLAAVRESWNITINQPFLDAGQPVFSSDYRVLGFISGWDPAGMKGLVYPIDRLLESAEKILEAGGDIRNGWLGVFLEESDAGVVVQRVEADSPAQEAGLRTSDFIRGFNGEKTGDVRSFINLVQNTAIGSAAGIDIVRQGKPMRLTVRIEERRPQQSQKRLSLNSPRPLIGLETVILNPHLADALQMPGTTGLFVVNVVSETPADRAGVLPGDVIVAMDGQPILDAAGFASYWQTHSLGDRLVLRILRKNQERTIIIPLRPASP